MKAIVKIGVFFAFSVLFSLMATAGHKVPKAVQNTFITVNMEVSPKHGQGWSQLIEAYGSKISPAEAIKLNWARVDHKHPCLIFQHRKYLLPVQVSAPISPATKAKVGSATPKHTAKAPLTPKHASKAPLIEGKSPLALSLNKFTGSAKELMLTPQFIVGCMFLSLCFVILTGRLYAAKRYGYVIFEQRLLQRVSLNPLRMLAALDFGMIAVIQRVHPSRQTNTAISGGYLPEELEEWTMPVAEDIKTKPSQGKKKPIVCYDESQGKFCVFLNSENRGVDGGVEVEDDYFWSKSPGAIISFSKDALEAIDLDLSFLTEEQRNLFLPRNSA